MESIFVLAQGFIQIDDLREPATAPWLLIVIAVVLVLGVGVASFKSSKRSHQD